MAKPKQRGGTSEDEAEPATRTRTGSRELSADSSVLKDDAGVQERDGREKQPPETSIDKRHPQGVGRRGSQRNQGRSLNYAEDDVDDDEDSIPLSELMSPDRKQPKRESSKKAAGDHTPERTTLRSSRKRGSTK